VAREEVCYYAIYKNKGGEDRIRFGVSRRTTAQIDTSLAMWQKIYALIANSSYRLVKIKANEKAHRVTGARSTARNTIAGSSDRAG
jgi:hypothetical protein